MRILLLCVLLISSKLFASTSLGDANDESSLYMKDGNTISSNFKDKSIKLTYLRAKNDNPFGFGITLKGKANDKLSTIFNGDDINPETSVSIPLSYQWILSDKPGRAAPTSMFIDDWLIVEFKYTKGDYQIFDETKDLDGQLFKESMSSTGAVVSYNAILNGNFLFGASVEYGKANNYGSLKEKTVKTFKTVYEDDATSRITESSTLARAGIYEEFYQRKANIDLMYYPSFFSGRIGIDAFLRYSTDEQKDSSVNPGLGIFLLKEGAPTKISGGVTVVRDKKEDETLVGLVVGYIF
jgi:hypothetical protein